MTYEIHCMTAPRYSSQKNTLTEERHPLSMVNERENQRPPITTPVEWLREYEREKEKEFIEMFDSNGEPMFDDPELFNTYVEKFPIGMKMKSIFYNLPYCEHLTITHLLDPMHIFKNVSSYLWRHISSKQSDTLNIRKDLITSKTKNKHWPRQLESTGEVGPSNWFQRR